MMKDAEQRSEQRRRAQQLWDRTKRDDVVVSERQKQYHAEMAKMARLKALRLAKEAADKEAGKTTPPTQRGDA